MASTYGIFWTYGVRLQLVPWFQSFREILPLNTHISVLCRSLQWTFCSSWQEYSSIVLLCPWRPDVPDDQFCVPNMSWKQTWNNVHEHCCIAISIPHTLLIVKWFSILIRHISIIEDLMLAFLDFRVLRRWMNWCDGQLFNYYYFWHVIMTYILSLVRVTIIH
jgi:hypothetical protein